MGTQLHRIKILEQSIEGLVHIIPANDSIKHKANGSCCYPLIKDVGAVHSAVDCREVYERIHNKPKKNKHWIYKISKRGKLINIK